MTLTAGGVSTAQPLPRFYGWVLVGVMALLLSVGTGTSIYLYSVIAGAVGEEFTAPRSMLMMGSTGMLLTMSVMSPLLGRLLDRYPNRHILISGAIVMGVGFILISLSTHLWQVIVCYLLFIGVGMGTLGMVSASTILARWFTQRRGLAMGIAALGTQLGGLIYPPVIASVMDIYDWRIAVGGLGVFVLVVIPLISHRFIIDRPDPQHGGRDSNPAAEPSQAADLPLEIPHLTFRELLMNRNFLLVSLMIGILSAMNTTVLSNLSLFATDIGEPLVRGAFLVSLIALLGILTSPLVGWLCDVTRIDLVTAVVMGSLATASLLYAGADTYTMLLLATFLQGAAAGGIMPLWASLVGRLFDIRTYGQVMGSTTMVVIALTASAPLLSGWVYDLSGSYRALFLALALILALLVILVPLIKQPGSTSEHTKITPVV